MARITIATWGEKYRFRVMNKENLLAYFDFVDQDTGLEFQDWQLMTGKNGEFVSAPGKKSYTNKDGKTVYPKYISAAYDAETESKRNAAGEKFFAAVLEAAKKCYEALNDGEAPAPKAKAKAAVAKKSGVGPLNNVPDLDDSDDDDQLPF